MFSACTADIAIFGGQAGGGKTWALLLEMARWMFVAGFRGLLLRRTIADQRKAGGLLDTATDVFGQLGASKRMSPDIDFIWKSGAKVQLSGCEQEEAIKEWQGAQLDLVGWDELTHFTKFQFWYLYTRMRSAHGKIKPYFRATCNPEPDSWVRELIAWWIGADGFAIPERSGVIRWLCREGDDYRWFDSQAQAQAWLTEIGDTDQDPVSVTFIPAKLSDNPILLKNDPKYRGRLAVQDAQTRALLLDGNWNARVQPGAFFDRSWFDVYESVPEWKDVVCACRAWDIADSRPTPERPNPDWTAGVLLYLLKNGRVVVCDVQHVRESEGAVDELMARIAVQDGPRVTIGLFQDPASAGKRDVRHLQTALRKALPSANITVELAGKGKDSKLTYARPFSAYVDPRTMADGRELRAVIVRAPWNSAYLGELVAFPPTDKALHDDMVDATGRAWLELAKRRPGGFAADFGKAWRG